MGKLGDKQAVGPLLAKLEVPEVRVFVGAALLALGEPRGTAALNKCLVSEDAELRRGAIFAYGQQRDDLDRQLLSLDLDGAGPWWDPRDVISQDRVAEAARQLGLSEDQVRSRFEALVPNFGLKLTWGSVPSPDGAVDQP